MRIINLPKDFVIYAEKLTYEYHRYRELIGLIENINYNFSKEERESAIDYYSNLFNEASIRFNLLKEYIHKNYILPEEQSDKFNWEIVFDDDLIAVYEIGKEKYETDNLKSEIQFHDFIHRLYGDGEQTKTEDYSGEYLAKSLIFQVTEDCNMSCTYCYQHNKKPNAMNFDTAKKCIDMLLDNDKKINTYFDTEKMVGITLEFIGGEPWLEIDLINEISDYFIGELIRRRHPWIIKYCFSICTNGLLHNTPKVQEYLKKHNYHLSYNITLDGNKKLHDACRIDRNGNGTYDRVIQSINNYKDTILQNNKEIPSKLTISPFNLPYLYDSILHMINIGYRRINLNCVMENVWEFHHSTELYYQLKKITDYLYENGLIKKIYLSIFDEMQGVPASKTLDCDSNNCGGTGKMLALDWRGNFFPCLRYMENSVDNREPYIIGDLENGINIKPDHKKRVDYLRSITRTSQNPEKCLTCPINSLCPSCNGYNYEYYGDPGKRTTFNCDLNKAQSLANVYYWRKRGEERPIYCPKDWAIEVIGEEEYNFLQELEVEK